MAAKLLNLIALSALAVLTVSYGPAPVAAVSVSPLDLQSRHIAGSHALVKKRADSKRCKKRPTTSPASKSASSTPAPSATPKPAPAPPAAPAPPPPSGGKGGLAWAAGNRPDVLRNFRNGKTATVYNWSPFKPDGAAAAGYEYVPMLWGTKDLAEFKRLVHKGYATSVLGMNEPDHGEQSNMDAGYAATLYRDVMIPLRREGYRIGAPAVTSGPSGEAWFRSFVGACKNMQIDCFDFVPIHWYGTNPQAFIKYVNDWHGYFGKPIWVTEFACQDFSGGPQASPGQIAAFAQTVTPFLDNAGFVERYFPFGVQLNMGNVNPANRLLGDNGQATPLGRIYLG